jgi:hypothetical protein
MLYSITTVVKQVAVWLFCVTIFSTFRRFVALTYVLLVSPWKRTRLSRWNGVWRNGGTTAVSGDKPLNEVLSIYLFAGLVAVSVICCLLQGYNKQAAAIYRKRIFVGLDIELRAAWRAALTTSISREIFVRYKVCHECMDLEPFLRQLLYSSRPWQKRRKLDFWKSRFKVSCS